MTVRATLMMLCEPSVGVVVGVSSSISWCFVVHSALVSRDSSAGRRTATKRETEKVEMSDRWSAVRTR